MMMHTPAPPTIPYNSLFQEELFKIRPSPLRQFLRLILCRILGGHLNSRLSVGRTKTVSINIDQSWRSASAKSSGIETDEIVENLLSSSRGTPCSLPIFL